jgi:hypothetical protein
MARKLMGDHEGSDATLPSPWINGLLASIFGMERHLVRKRLFFFGTSVLAVLSLAP